MLPPAASFLLNYGIRHYDCLVGSSIDSAITSVNSQRATFGAAVNQLTYAIDNLSSVKVNAEASQQDSDTDYASQTSELARTQIIQQAGTAMLAQANQLPQTVLSLLQ